MLDLSESLSSVSASVLLSASADKAAKRPQGVINQ